MRNPGGERTIALSRSQSALSQRGVVVTMNQVVHDAGMSWVFLPQLFQNGSRLKLLGQSRVIGCGITNGQDRKGVKGFRFEIIGILLVELTHRRFIGEHPVTRSNWSMARLPNGARGRAVRCVVVDVKRGNKSALAVCPGRQ